MQDIIIKLKESEDARNFLPQDMIHFKEFDEVKNQIKNKIEAAYKNSLRIENERTHDTITILGTRGSGKTSFLLSLLKEYQKDRDVLCLDIIDPTLIEDKAHVFLNIISLINDQVLIKLDRDDCNPKNSEYVSRQSWQELLHNLSHGLPSIDGVGKGMEEDNWQDPEFIMDKGMRSISSANNLEKNFNKLISNALEILQKKIILLAFDDIDVDFKKGWPVLETIRKYCTSSNLIVLLSGDLKLYSLAVRKQHWVNFGREFIDIEGAKLEKLWSLESIITEMEGQYLQKVLKLDKRYHLKTIYGKLLDFKYENNESKIFVEGEKSDKTEIKSRYEMILSHFGIRNLYQAEVYTTFLLDLPLRSQIRFLALLQSIHEKDISANVDNSNLSDAFLSDLYDKRVNVQLTNSVPKYINVEILKLLIREKQLGESYQLQPSTTNTSLNGALMALSLVFSNFSRGNPHLIFDYFIKIGYLRNLISSLDYAGIAENNLSNPSIEGICKHSGIYSDKVLRDEVGLILSYAISANSYLRSSKTSSGMSSKETPIAGTYFLKALAVTRKRNSHEMADRLDQVLKDQNIEKKVLGYMPFSLSKYSSKQLSIPIYSIFTLLGAIGELCRKHSAGDVQKGLIELSQIRIYDMPNFNRNHNYDTNSESEEEELNKKAQSKKAQSNKENFLDLESLFKDWANKFPNLPTAPHLLGKIITRAYYNLETINQSPKGNTLGDVFHRQIIAFLHAVVIEDVKENCSAVSGLNISNAVTSDKLFIDNLKAVYEYYDKDNLYLSRWLLSCPLFILYLNSDSDKDLASAMKNYTEYELINELFSKSIYKDLNKVNRDEIIANSEVNTKEKSEEKLSKKDLKYRPIINKLKDIKAPFLLFKSGSKAEVTLNNKNIRKDYSHLLTENGKSIDLSDFRAYLAKNEINW